MQIARNTIETTVGPSEWFTGAVYVDTLGATLVDLPSLLKHDREGSVG
jgi:hypothetical protein